MLVKIKLKFKVVALLHNMTRRKTTYTRNLALWKDQDLFQAHTYSLFFSLSSLFLCFHFFCYFVFLLNIIALLFLLSPCTPHLWFIVIHLVLLLLIITLHCYYCYCIVIHHHLVTICHHLAYLVVTYHHLVINGHLVVVITLFMPSLPCYYNCSLIIVHDHPIVNLNTNIAFTYHLVVVHLISLLFVVIILTLNMQVINNYCIVEATTTTFTL